MTGQVRLQDEGADRERYDDENRSKRYEIHFADVGHEGRR